MSTISWTADNGDGSFTNPLFYEEFSDPDLIRVGSDFYMTGTTMHTMPGLPLLHSTDLVNWQLKSYAFDVLDLGPGWRLEDGQDIYGQGIWAPCLRYHDGQFHIFTNINGHRTQIFTASAPEGPWQRREMTRNLHDLSVLFDDDGKAWVVWGYQGLRMAQLTADLTDFVPGTERQLTAPDAGMGEGVHFYKIDGTYLVTSAWFEGRMRMPAARARALDGPWEVNPALSMDEDFGLNEGYRLKGDAPPFEIIAPNSADGGRMSLHQGGVVDTPDGVWWGFSMMDYNSLGRLTCLSPVTWQDGWPYFGLAGNLKRTPRSWAKPEVATPSPAQPLFMRDDAFDGPALLPIWQWNHVPVAERWSLSARPGHLRLMTLPAADLWQARNTLTQRAIGPVSAPVAELDAAGLAAGDVAGLALVGRPYRWIGVERRGDDFAVLMHDQQSGETTEAPLAGPRVWLRADCDFITEEAQLSWSADGERFTPLGSRFAMVFQLKTFQGIRYGLFAFNRTGQSGGHADFAGFRVEEPFPRGVRQPIPHGKRITLKVLGRNDGIGIIDGAVRLGPPAAFEVIALGTGRVALKAAQGVLAAGPDGRLVLTEEATGDASGFQWIETPAGELVLMNLATHRFIEADATTGGFACRSPGPTPDRGDLVRLVPGRVTEAN